MNKNGRAKPFPYQKEGVRMIEGFNGRALLADSYGLGKTLQILWTLRRNPSWLPALVVCPASVKYQWEFEANRHISMRASVCEGQKPPRFNRQNFSFQSPLTIINYDILTYWIPYLKKLNFKTIVFDESQAISNSKTLRTKASKTIAKGIPHVIALSGTPLLNRPSELFPILNILWPETYNNWWSYAQEFCSPRRIFGRWDFSGSSNLDKLHKELKAKGMIRRLKSEVLKDLPQKITRILPCELLDPDEYKSASTDFMGWLQKNMAHKVRSASRAEKLVRIGYLLQLTARLKMKSVVNWSNRFLEETEEKLILFTTHKKAIDVLQKRIEAPSIKIDGSVAGRKRRLAVEQFANDPKYRLCVANIQAAGTGTDGLQKSCSTAGVVELPWRPGDLGQLEGRLDRIGQTNKVWINYFIAGDTLEEDLCKLLQKKQKVISAVLDGGSTPQDLNLHDELIKVLEKKAKE